MPATPDILIVDDSPDWTEVMSLALREEGFRVATASSGLEALTFLKRNRAPLCVLLDFRMPGLDGLELAVALRAKYQDDVVLIGVSGAQDIESERVRNFVDAVDHVLWKPMDWDRLMSILGREPR